MADDDNDDNDIEHDGETKEARKRRKELRRRKREEFQKRLDAVKPDDIKTRNRIILEIVKDHLHKDIDVFQARWQQGTALSNTVFSNTPLFWYKKHHWTHKDVKEFFKIVGVYKDNLDSELSVIWGIDETSKKKKKEKRKRLKEKHLRKESFASLLTLRHSSLRLMRERSASFVQQNDPKAERASISIWNTLTKSRGGNKANEACEDLLHHQFDICLNDNKIQVDPDMSVDLFYELIRTWEIIEKHREEKRNNPEKYAQSKKDKYKQSRANFHHSHQLSSEKNDKMSMKAIGGSSALLVSPQLLGHNDDDDDELEAVEKESDGKGDSEKKEDDVPQKDKIKYIKKKTINRQHIKRMLRHINKNIKREHLTANPKKLKKSKLILVVFQKIFHAIENGQQFDVQNDYISQALTAEQLNNPSELLDILGTRDAEWKQRVQCLEYLESNLQTNENLAPLFEEENFLLLIVGWTTQLYDERSRITQTAAELFPSLLTVCLSSMETPAIIFEEEENECLSTILEALFCLLRNKRAKTLSDIAHDVLIETINILATVAEDLDPTAYHRMVDMLLQHTQIEHEKHEKVRAGCIAYSLFIIYGTAAQEEQQQAMLNGGSGNNLVVENGLNAMNKSSSVTSDDATPNVSDNEDEVKEMLEKRLAELKQKNVKMAKEPQRAFLFEDDVFMTAFGKILENGVEDKGKETREKAMKVLKKVEVTHRDLLEKYIDGLILNKYEKWKKYSAPKKTSKKQKRTPIRKQKSIKKTAATKEKD